ncbi:MAG: Rrf2 family transcriptional regulator [Candidatus Omnitrophica bacterium]|nr:Rrf2 family transcriptional regulator [Candidatus Omnitrophota bacterium]MDE2221916.1 Rrf2 family transcriptional regulator [Candidatus Omnitrophota bacterium]
MISKTSLWTVKALLALSHLPAGEAEGVNHIAQKIKAPRNYLGKVLQRLVKEGIVASRKGLKGGFRLLRTPDTIKLFDIVNALEDIDHWDGCLMGNGSCSATAPCCAHDRWTTVRRAYQDFLKNTTIADLDSG